jgi:uncharacterized protein
MKILLIGASGIIGSRILNEAVNRGHTVTAVARHVEGLHGSDRVHVVQADATDTQRLTALAAGQDAIVSSMSPRGERGPEQYLAGVHSVLAAVKANHTPYVLFVGGTSGLYNSNGQRIIDQLLETIPAEKLTEPLTGIKAREIIEKSDVNWTFFCPDGTIEPGERTGKFRLGGTQAVVDWGTPSRISCEDYAVAAIDELEHPQHQRQVFNICY